MAHWITKAELSRRGKCSHQLITKKCAKGGPFAKATSETGKVDVDHEVVVNWLITREIVISPNDITTKQFEQMTVMMVVEHYGNIDKLEGYIKTRKLIAETEHKQVMMAEKRNELVDRETIAKACFGFLSGATHKLLEMPKGVVERIGAILETQTPSAIQESEEYLIEEISRILQGVKKEIGLQLKLNYEQQQELEFKEKADIEIPDDLEAEDDN